MELKLTRRWFTDKSTIGQLKFDGTTLYTLEDKVRPVKIKGETAIAAGKYEVIINWSERFGKLMPLLLDVPGFSGIRIHSGNSAADTEGCILVGMTRGQDSIGQSRLAYSLLMPKLKQACAEGKVWIEIVEEQRDEAAA